MSRQQSHDDTDSSDAFSLSLAPFITTSPANGNNTVGIIIVPATRSVASLRHSINLAATSNTPIVVIVSHGIDSREVEQAIERARATGCVIKVSDNYVVPFMAQFATTTHHRVTNRKSNLSAKRNLGLLLGHLTSTNLFFLDDDIRNMTAAKLQGAGYALKDHAVAGFLSYEFPDNSVVRHAYRLSGGDQAVFIAGNSLAVNTSAIESFFPNVYNEDWLFFHDAIKQKRAATVGLVNQLPYDPFTPSRTTSEEFGCVLATEGLYTLLASGKPHTDADKKYWSEALTRRKIFVSEVKEQLNKSGRKDAQFMRALLCLEAALHELEQYTPTDFTSYVKAWRKDLREWKELLRDLPTGLSLPEAINFIQETKLVSEIPLAIGLSQNEINFNLVA